MHQFLLITCGLPASGKTTLAKILTASLAAEVDVVIVSTDKWRDKTYYEEFKPENERIVREKALRKTKSILAEGKSVIHDDTNYYTSMRHELFETAEKYGASFGILYLTTPIDVCFMWNKDREYEIPIEVIRKIDERLDIPRSKYAWDREIISIDLSVIDVKTAVDKIVSRVRNLTSIRIDRIETSQTVAEERDIRTRQVISEFLNENEKFQSEQIVHQIRAEILRDANREELSVDATVEMLWKKLRNLAKR